jgi:uncharacterized protein (TIGR02099 family)
MINRIILVNRVLKKIWITLAILIILAAVISSIFRSITPWAKQYKGEVEQHLTFLFGQPVTIQTMETGWYWFHPVLKLKQVELSDGNKKSLHLEKLLVGINLFKSLWSWRIQPGILYIDDIHLNIRQSEGHWNIDGISTKDMKNTEMTPERTEEILVWLSQQERFIIKHVSVYFYFSDGGFIPVSGLNISVVNKGGIYRLKGDAKLEQTNSTYFQLLGNVSFDPRHQENTMGQIYFSVKHLEPAQWQSVFPKTADRLEGGKGDIALWVDLKKGAVSSVQAEIKFKRLAWRLLKNNNSQIIQNLYANLSWKPDDNGWQFKADHIKLRAGGVVWPENQLLIKFDKTQQAYQLFVKSIIIESLLSQTINWPASIHNLLQIKPHGNLSNTQLLIKEKQISYLLTRFDQLGWNAQDNIPHVYNLSGVLNWQQEEGRLELDSENTSFEMKGYPVQKFDLLNGSIDWKEISDGLRVSIDRFVLSQPELTISTQGAIDQVTRSSVGHIRLVTEFSAKNVQKWKPFLPKAQMKAKLYDWLTNDIKRIGEATGKIVINGLAKDFPFDNNNGEFSIISHASGGDLLINPKWQLIKDVEGYIKLKNRNLDIDIVNADFQGAPVKQMNLRIDDIGNDRENLLIHGIINASAQKMLNYVMASPLKEKLNALSMLSMEGLLSLDLRLEIPLYPENDTNLAKGDLVFKNNTILIKHQLKKIPVEEVSGDLSFDEHGVTQSALTATAFGYPLKIKVQSVRLPKPATGIFVDGECSVESLKSRFNIPLFSYLKGMFSVKAIFKLNDDPNELDTLNIQTSLQGLAVNLPAPLGKVRETIAPLEVNVDLNTNKTLRFRANYNNRLSSDILLQEKKGGLELKSGEVRLGTAPALNQNKPGLALVGALDGFDLHEWKKVIENLSTEQTNGSLLSQLRFINVKMAKLNFFNQQFDNMAVKAKLLANKDWTFSLNQKKIAADLTYHKPTNTLSGFVKYLHLAKIDKSNDTIEFSSKMNPGQIPNLNVRIDNLSVGEIKIGDITLKSQSTPERWLIDYLRINSPVYQINIEGAWTQKGTKNQTKMHLKLHLKDLAKSLERWDITPAVDAGKGDLEFQGGWNNTLYDFSLASLDGTMNMQLKNGRITHLSPETEEKLGLGKLLSVLSLQTIPRRLQLDFSDLSHQGYSFDTFKGTFSVKKGIMSTQDSYIDGPVAYASMKGDLDLVRRMYDLNLSISPHITASLPIVATIAGGPIAGIATWVASKIINQSMQKITAYSYKISGPWKQPIVQQLTIVKKSVEN